MIRGHRRVREETTDARQRPTPFPTALLRMNPASIPRISVVAARLLAGGLGRTLLSSCDPYRRSQCGRGRDRHRRCLRWRGTKWVKLCVWGGMPRSPERQTICYTLPCHARPINANPPPGAHPLVRRRPPARPLYRPPRFLPGTLIVASLFFVAADLDLIHRDMSRTGGGMRRIDTDNTHYFPVDIVRTLMQYWPYIVKSATLPGELGQVDVLDNENPIP